MYHGTESLHITMLKLSILDPSNTVLRKLSFRDHLVLLPRVALTLSAGTLEDRCIVSYPSRRGGCLYITNWILLIWILFVVSASIDI